MTIIQLNNNFFRLILFIFLITFYNNASCITPESNPNINLDFQNVSVKDVLQILANIRKMNLIISAGVKGSVTCHLDNISWEKALDVILKEQGLIEKKSGNVLMIFTPQEIKQRQEYENTLNAIAPIETQTISLHYAKAQNVLESLKNQNKSLFSERGNIIADIRTNSLLIEDVPTKMTEIKKYISAIDIPVKQVLIEARIVTIDEKHEEEIGVRFGITRPQNNLTGTLEGASQLGQNISAAQIDPLSRLNVDLPSQNPHAASIALGIATLGGGNLLDLELSALESEGIGQIISSPRLITADQQPATILSGQEIPYQQSAKYGATSIAFQKAVLSLTVTPQITPEHQLLLALQVNQDRPGSTLVQGVPEIDTREIKTQVLINNGQTLVLGGIYEQHENNQVEKVPLLGDIPLLGKLFQHHLKKNSKRELLIFVTPSVIEN